MLCPDLSYDVFKNMIISLDMMKDGLGLHFTSSFLAVSSLFLDRPDNTIAHVLLHAIGYRRDNNMRSIRCHQISGKLTLCSLSTPEPLNLTPLHVISDNECFLFSIGLLRHRQLVQERRNDMVIPRLDSCLDSTKSKHYHYLVSLFFQYFPMSLYGSNVGSRASLA